MEVDYVEKYKDLAKRICEVSEDEDWRGERFCDVVHHLFDDVVEQHRKNIAAYDFVDDVDKITDWLVRHRYVLLGISARPARPDSTFVTKVYYQAFPSPFVTLVLRPAVVQAEELDPKNIRESLKGLIEKYQLKVIPPNVTEVRTIDYPRRSL